MTRYITIELHDVTPARQQQLRDITAALAELQLPAATLLVVPAYLDQQGRAWDLRASPPFVRWLRQQVAAGAEVVQHGLTHRAPGPPPFGLKHLPSQAMHRWFSRGEAEFALLDRAEAASRLARGRRILADCDLHAAGFIAPAWQQSRDALAEVRRAGFAFTAFLNHVQPLCGCRPSLRTPALTFAASHPVIDRGKRVVMRCLERIGRDAELLRVALHPVDAESRSCLDHILDRLRRLLRHRQPTTYASWLRIGGGGDHEPCLAAAAA